MCCDACLFCILLLVGLRISGHKGWCWAMHCGVRAGTAAAVAMDSQCSQRTAAGLPSPKRQALTFHIGTYILLKEVVEILKTKDIGIP